MLRGINVGGKGRLPMKELVAELEGMGLENVRTYIQSGNVVFDSSKKLGARFGDEIGQRIEASHGFRPAVMLIGAKGFRDAVAGNPYAEAKTDPKTVHLFFLGAKPRAAKVAELEPLRTQSEEYQLVGKVLYLHTPEGFAKSKLAAGVERVLGVAVTARNWRTVTKVSEMVEG